LYFVPYRDKKVVGVFVAFFVHPSLAVHTFLNLSERSLNCYMEAGLSHCAFTL
jgi:hypothetical protein